MSELHVLSSNGWFSGVLGFYEEEGRQRGLKSRKLKYVFWDGGAAGLP